MIEIPGLAHGTVTANDIDLHYVEVGEGPLVLFVHGFPESWYSWRHQLPALAAAGHRAVAIDVRGYGGSSAPPDIEDYRMLRHVADNVALVAALGEREATVVGHDWGAPIAWASAQLRPDVFSAVAGLSVPFAPAGPNRPSDAFGAMGGEEQFYISYFQEPGTAEAEIAGDVRRWLLGLYWTLSGEGMAEQLAAGVVPGMIAPGGRMDDKFLHREELPGWLSEADLDYYVAAFERSGFAGPLHRYRNVDRDWEDLSVWGYQPIEVPSLFIGGELDGPTMWGQRALERFDRTLPGLTGSHLLPGCGHWVPQERPEEVNRLLLAFLAEAQARR